MVLILLASILKSLVGISLGVTIDGTDSLVVAPDAIDSLTTLYNGASVTGSVVRAVPVDGAQDGVLAVRPGLLADKVFVAVK